ncbi:MAG: putative P-loop ATPase, partial [Bacteroidota bacterium]
MNNIKNKICCVKWIETYIYFPTLTVILLLSILGIVSPAGFRNNNIENLKLFLVAITSSHVFSIILRIIQITQQRTIILKDNSTTIIYGAVLFSISLFIPVTWTPLAKLLDLNTINEWSLMMLSITSLFIRFTYKNEISSENYEIEKLFHHRKELSDRIKEYLIQRNYNSQPEVIGIFGTWGSGKTFFLEQLKKKLEKEKKEQMFIIYFNPLRFLDNKTAIIKFLETLKFEYEKFIDGPLFEFQDYLEIIGEKQKDWISKLLQYSPTGYQFDDLEKITLRLNQIIKTHK